MENEQDNIIESPNDEIELDLDLQEETPAEEVKEEKPQETPEAKLARLDRQASQLRKKLGQDKKSESKSESSSTTKPSDIGYAEKAYLLAHSNIREENELNLVKDWVEDTGKSLDQVLNSKRFQDELKDLREEKTTKQAIPTGTKRSSPTVKDSVDYWVNKPFNEVPQEMREAVVNKRLELEKNVNPFK